MSSNPFPDPEHFKPICLSKNLQIYTPVPPVSDYTSDASTWAQNWPQSQMKFLNPLLSLKKAQCHNYYMISLLKNIYQRMDQNQNLAKSSHFIRIHSTFTLQKKGWVDNFIFFVSKTSKSSVRNIYWKGNTYCIVLYRTSALCATRDPNNFCGATRLILLNPDIFRSTEIKWLTGSEY